MKLFDFLKTKTKPLDFPELIDQYIKSKKLAWARTSQKNERARLNKHGKHVLDAPKEYYDFLKTYMKAYSIKSTFTRLGKFYEFLVKIKTIPFSENPWKTFLSDNALLFKYSYQTERLKVTYHEARIRILTIEEYQYRMAALQMLEAGLRYCELRTFDGERVIGKGSKPRAVFMRAELKLFRYSGSYTPLFKILKSHGLKPHTLRKLCATELSNRPGVSDVDIMEVFGWNDIGTSAKYRQPMRKEKLSAMLNDVVESAKNEKVEV
jgi:integrase